MIEAVNIIFDGPPGPTAGRFVEVEDDAGNSLRIGEWIERPDGLWSLRIALGTDQKEKSNEGKQAS